MPFNPDPNVNLTDSPIRSAGYSMQGVVTTPTLTPGGNEYSISPKRVTIRTVTADAFIRYTLDGSAPTPDHGSLIQASFGTVDVVLTAGGRTLRAMAYKSGSTNSGICTGTYSLMQGNSPTVAPIARRDAESRKGSGEYSCAIRVGFG